MLTTAHCLVIKVNNHATRYDGTICPHPERHDCGASDWFRSKYCGRGVTECFDHALFSADNPGVRKRTDEVDRDKFFTEAVKAVQGGENPIFFFYNNPGWGKFYLAGLYVVEQIQVDGSGFGVYDEKKDFRVIPKDGYAIRFAVPGIDSSIVWEPTMGNSPWCHRMFPTEVTSSLERIVAMHEALLQQPTLEQPERDECEAVVAKLQQLVTDLNRVESEGQVDESVTSEMLHQLKTSAEQGAHRLSSRAKPMQRSLTQPAVVGQETSTAEAKTPVPEVPSRVASLPQTDWRDQRFAEQVAATVQSVKDYTQEQGLYYSDDLLKRYHLSLLTKPFVILAGVSGGGKTQLAMSYARATDGELLVVPVRPDWTDNQSLLGNYDVLNRCFVPTQFTRFLRQAAEDYRDNGKDAKDYYVLLDEMNLARVEYYFSDFLSTMELPAGYRRIWLYDQAKDPFAQDDFPQVIELSPNFYVTGTVNIDETTHSFSPKVLDRANFIRLNDINLDEMLALLDSWQPAILVRAVAELSVQVLKDINTILRGANQQFGYRTTREIIRWVDLAVASGMDPYLALDVQIAQKILVKLQGSQSNSLERAMLNSLFNYLRASKDQSSDGSAFPRCFSRLQQMLETMKEDEFTFGQH